MEFAKMSIKIETKKPPECFQNQLYQLYLY